ncbi:putative ubiquinone biosynthesis protein [Phaeomoniella chlamydospora]|uniref:5-demethoxyubiquinone hydroxylase, mitochondrial n=1 Tax=Phaeomoniella chlamydospora TaxID=158046 RepID=A0A0G2GPK8_PHACM|nr:putative ubiquinone biosynthesis protein [Phaeomoniella chlamydospora]
MEAARALRALVQSQQTVYTLQLNFLAPRILSRQRRSFHKTSNAKAEVHEGRPSPARKAQLSKDQKAFLDRALRVNHAGELAAVRIYTAQTPTIVKSHPHLRPLMKHMYDQEVDHFDTFTKMLARHRIRPTAMYPVWQAAASLLGWSTAMMGQEAAMACTEAVETAIGDHYNEQVRELFKWMQDMRARGEDIDPEIVTLIDILKRIRDEELEHLDHAVEHDAHKARPYEPITKVIEYGCKGAIWITERI